MTEHRHERTDARSSGDEQQRAAGIDVPDKVPTDRPAELQLVACAQLAREIRRHLAILEAFDGELQPVPVRCRCDRIAPLRLVAVVGGQTDIDVLACMMPRPAGHIDHDAANPRALIDELDDITDPPAQSPLYRCSCHGSPYMW